MPVFGYFIMTFQVPDILTLFAFSVLMIVLLKIVLNHEKASSIPNMPPGPWKLPIIGNIHQLLTSAPHQKLRDLAKIHGPLTRLQLGEVTVIIVSSPKYAKEIMKTHDAIFASRPHSVTSDILSYQSTGIASAPYGNYWNVVRKMCTVELLGKNRVTSFQSLRKEELTNLIKMIDSKKESPVNLTETVLSSIYSIVSRAAFGNKCKDQQEFISLVKEGLAVLGDLFPSGRWLQLVTGFRPKLERLHEKIDRILENIIVEHKETKSDGKEGESAESEDLVDILLKLQDGNDRNQNICLTDNNIKATIQEIFSAGGEPSAITIDWAMAAMVKDPRVMKKAQAEVRKVMKMKGRVDESCMNELKYLKVVVKETLRLHPPGPLLLPRECGETCEIDGYHIPAKSMVIVNAWAIGRDPNYWSDPERFYPERFIDSSIDYKGCNFEYIPFGGGRRICPGITFGLANVEMALALLLYHFDWKLPNGMRCEELDNTEEFRVTIRRKDDLFLIPLSPPTLVSQI
ncbi:cytochrome P450 71D11-like [Vigna unguiculata]|uniref:Cytochrome P450 n=1 Tax=Vigna unguiculata TaxID=3917 RepID=A0A4D6LLH7_VIGUN|nr:cytochrome P450 71D11-like [Vigna unguiculata]QCD89126.1 Cytochrome P450 [Vigna unguiculata]